MEVCANEFGHEPLFVAHDAAREAHEARLAANREVQGLIVDIEELIERMKDATDPELTLARTTIEASIGAVRQTILDTAEQVQRQTQQAIEVGVNYVRERPWEAIGVASAAGLALGFVLGRR